MSASKVYFTDMRCKVGESLLVKLDRLISKAGIGKIDFNQKYVAIKIHFGEPGNLAFLRPNFAKVVADHIKSLGGKPFLTDCNTLYVGRRNNALVHMDAAFENGYSPLATGVQNIIADGLKGTDDVDVPVKGGTYITVAHIGRAIMDADIVVSLNHFKGHEGTGFGGAIKNIGMGSGSRAGKMAMHNDGKPEVDQNVCTGCKACTKYCNENAIEFGENKKAKINHKKCVGCGRCIGGCNFNAISNENGSSNEALNCKMAEYAKAVLDGRPNFHINIINQVSPYCDCHGESDAPVVADIGIFASFDPIALDKACIDAVNAAPGIQTSILGDRDHKHKDANGHSDHFKDIHPTTDWRSQIEHAEKIGLGSGTYELVTVK
ncbi:4Fe-4S ferredoxin [Spirochaetia bacterium]|nr:4Fe-4S ferredoxin [Spirochaetia bacterium]